MRVYPLLTQTSDRFRDWRVFALALAAAFLATLVMGVPLRAETAPAPEAIASMVGDDVAVNGAASFNVVNGRSSALLASGSEVTVRSGKARIDLDADDTIAVCGPAHFTILKAGGTITLALDYGEVHPQLNSGIALTIYMPLIVATPVAIGEAPRDLTVGLDQAGSLCIMTARGALRIEEELGGQGMLVPQGGQVSFSGGQLNAIRSSSEPCSCELLVVADTVEKQFAMNLQPTAPNASQQFAPAAAPPLDGDGPIYRISVPLVFDAALPKLPAAADPPTILLDEVARLQPKTTFEGDVEAAPPPPEPPLKDAVNSESETKKPGVFGRMFGFLHRRRDARCAGVGCTS